MDNRTERERFLIKISHADGVLTHLQVGLGCPLENHWNGWVQDYRFNVQQAKAAGHTWDVFPATRWDFED